MNRNRQPVRERLAIAAMAVKQHQHAPRLAERPDPLLDARAVDRVDHPDPARGGQRVGGALRRGRLGGDPSEPNLGLVAEADLHGYSDAGPNTRTGSIRMITRRSPGWRIG